MKKSLARKLFVLFLIVAVFLSVGLTVHADNGVLKNGDKSDDVKKLQEMLKTLGYFNDVCTGYFGDITEKAVKSFQKDNKLDVDGIVGSATMNLLKKLVSQSNSSSRSSDTRNNNYITYKVTSGDSVWKLSQYYNVTVDAILSANNLNENSVLQIGQELKIPSSITVVSTATSVSKSNNTNDNNSNTNNTSTHIVQQGECSSQIAEDYGVSLKALLKLNNLTESSILQIGQVLKIPTDEQNIELGETTEALSNESTGTAESKESAATTGEYLSWFDEVQYIFEKGDIAVVTDVKTGKTFKVKRMQGHNHADVEPLTADDTAVMKSLYGSWSWDRRAVIITVDGRDIAGSMNGMPHGNQSISDNNFKGHFCIHFKGSKTHAGNKVDSTHQAMVKKAAGL